MEAGAELGHRQFRHARAPLAAAGKELAHLVPRAPPDLRRRSRRDTGRFVDLKKNDFIGREAAAREKEDGGKLRRVTFVVDADDADVLGDEPIWHDGKVVGWVTSGGYAHHVDRSLAQGYVPKALARERRERLRDRDPRREAHGDDPAGAAVRSGR